MKYTILLLFVSSFCFGQNNFILTVNAQKRVADDSAPTVQATNIVFTNVLSTSMTISFTPGNGTARLVLVKSGSAVNQVPVDGGSYTANSTFGSGTQLGTGNYVCYFGAGSSFNLTGLTFGTTYYVQVFASNFAFLKFLTTTATGNPANQQTSSQPSVQASNITFTSKSTSSWGLTWTSGNGSNRVVVMKAAADLTASPSNGVTYTANSTFGSGTQIGTGNYVVYKGSGNSVTITGLSSSLTYVAQVFEFFGSGGTESYFTNKAYNNPIFDVTDADKTYTMYIAPSTEFARYKSCATLSNVSSQAFSNGFAEDANNYIMVVGGAGQGVLNNDQTFLRVKSKTDGLPPNEGWYWYSLVGSEPQPFMASGFSSGGNPWQNYQQYVTSPIWLSGISKWVWPYSANGPTPASVYGVGMAYSDDLYTSPTRRTTDNPLWGSKMWPKMWIDGTDVKLIIHDASYHQVGTSTTSINLSTLSGTASLTVTNHLNYELIGNQVKVSSHSTPTEFFTGDIVSYDYNTGALVLNNLAITGTGTYASWDTNTPRYTIFSADLYKCTVTQLQDYITGVTSTNPFTLVGARVTKNLNTDGTLGLINPFKVGGTTYFTMGNVHVPSQYADFTPAVSHDLFCKEIYLYSTPDDFATINFVKSIYSDSQEINTFVLAQCPLVTIGGKSCLPMHGYPYVTQTQLNGPSPPTGENQVLCRMLVEEDNPTAGSVKIGKDIYPSFVSLMFSPTRGYLSQASVLPYEHITRTAGTVVGSPTYFYYNAIHAVSGGYVTFDKAIITSRPEYDPSKWSITFAYNLQSQNNTHGIIELPGSFKVVWKPIGILWVYVYGSNGGTKLYKMNYNVFQYDTNNSAGDSRFTIQFVSGVLKIIQDETYANDYGTPVNTRDYISITKSQDDSFTSIHPPTGDLMIGNTTAEGNAKSAVGRVMMMFGANVTDANLAAQYIIP